MENEVIQKVEIISRKANKTMGSVVILSWNKRARTNRALKFLAICWGLAVFCIILPLVHFVLVPGFFIAGPIVAYIMSKQESVVLSGEGVCPECQGTMRVARSRDRWPLEDICSKCFEPVKLNKI